MEETYENWLKIHFGQTSGTSGILTEEETEKINEQSL
jgi:hypothetical protein